MGHEFELKTSDVLLRALQGALAKKPTPREIMNQRVSFVFGSLDAKSNVTREQVRKIIEEQEGLPVT